jgi:hypothetical protein
MYEEEGPDSKAEQEKENFLNPIPVIGDDESVSIIKVQQVNDNDKEAEEEVKVPEESKVGKKLSDLTTRRVIILVLVMLFSQSFLQTT